MEKIILFGCGQMLARNIAWLKRKFQIILLSDNDSGKWGKFYYGIECVPPMRLSQYPTVRVKVVIENEITADEVRKQLISYGMKKVEKLFKRKVCCETIFDRAVPEKVWIFGCLWECRFLDDIISRYYKNVNVAGYASCSIKEIGTDKVSGKRVVSFYYAAKDLIDDTNCGIVAVAYNKSFSVVTKRTAARELLDSGRYFIVSNEIFCSDVITEQMIKNIFTPYQDCYRIGTIQFLVTRNCNLNCKLCSHFAPLVSGKKHYNFELFQRDSKRIAEIFDTIDEIGLWGGEALLVENLGDYIRHARKIFPMSRIVIGTNGLLLKKINNDVFGAMKETGAMFAISLYPPTLDQIEEIKELLDKNGIAARYPGGIKIDKFFRRYDLIGKNDIEKRYDACESKFCTTVFEGKMAACYFPICATDFNKAFEEGFDVMEDIIDIYDESICRDVLLRRVRTPLKACRYCGEIKLEDWGVAGKHSEKQDWVLNAE